MRRSRYVFSSVSEFLNPQQPSDNNCESRWPVTGEGRRRRFSLWDVREILTVQTQTERHFIDVVRQLAEAFIMVRGNLIAEIGRVCRFPFPLLCLYSSVSDDPSQLRMMLSEERRNVTNPNPFREVRLLTVGTAHRVDSHNEALLQQASKG